MHQNPELTFNYALYHPTLGWYTGRASAAGEGPESMFSLKRMDAFTYTANGAHLKKATFPCFRECVVERMA